MRSVVTAFVVLAVASTVHAQPGFKQAGSLVAEQASDQALGAQRLALAQQILRAREDAQQREAFGQNFRQHWLDRLTKLSVAQLATLADAGPATNLEESIAASSPNVLADTATQDLGNSTADLVYTKVAPCRIVDTRVSGGPVGTASSRDFYVAGTNPAGFMGQGGGPCGIHIGATSVAVNITVVGATGPGWLRAYPYGGSGNASVINYKAGDTIANGLIVPVCDPALATCTRDLTVVADSYGAHVLLDVMGYFQYVNKADYRSTVTTAFSTLYAPVPFYPDCVSMASATVVAPGPGVILVEAAATIELNHAAGVANAAYWGIATTATGCTFGLGNQGWALVPAAAPSGYYYESDRAIYKSEVSTAGSYTFYLNATKQSGADNHFQKGSLAATFHPQ